MQAEHVDNSRGLLLSSTPFCIIWSACLGLEWVPGLGHCWCLHSLSHIPVWPPWALMSDTLVTPQRNAAEKSLSLSFLNIPINSPLICLVRKYFSCMISWFTNLIIIASVICEWDQQPKASSSQHYWMMQDSQNWGFLIKDFFQNCSLWWRGRRSCIKSLSILAHFFLNL